MDDVKAATGHLQENGQVFGELRLPTVLVRWAGEGSNRIAHAMLVDFDLSGEPVVTRHPIDINTRDVEWLGSVAPLELIDAAHDLANAEKLRENLLAIAEWP
ncbi:hypothetical protein FRB94_008895 [Tulasnella sp. JGI-2019a]|nr:hypothetical protein FRB94_008895 [Tulasnella sp. JGI-2019a]KAG9026621.1 hypothetical protein FRB95_008648 [Tulasnella sp. JGI-2019a]